MTQYGKWIVWGKPGKPEGINGDRKMQACYISGSGIRVTDATDYRTFGGHYWDEETLAYRLEVEPTHHSLFGIAGESTFRKTRLDRDTHRIEYAVRGDEVVLCRMVKL